MIETSGGTTQYMAPEQIEAKARPASDQYALGIVVYEWLCGERPFNGSFAEILTKHIMTPPPPLSQKMPDLSPEVEQVVLTALAKDPRQRFGSVQAFAAALEQAMQIAKTRLLPSPFGILPNLSTHIPDPAVPPSQHLPPIFPDKLQTVGRRIPRRYAVVGLIGLGLAAVGGTTYLIFAQQGGHTPNPTPDGTPNTIPPNTPQGGNMDNWTLRGNTNTNPPDDFMGTTDSKKLIFKTNNTPAIWIDENRQVRIGIDPPEKHRLAVIANDQFGFQVQGPNSGVGAGIHLEPVGGKIWEILATGTQSTQGEGKFNIRSGSDHFTITDSGDIGIGTTNPHARLDVEGNLFVNGSISKTGGGEFVRQPHPLDPTQHIVYATPIGNEVGTYTRGRGNLVKGEATIQLPEHFGLVTSEDDLTVQLTPRGEWLQLYVVHLDSSHIIIREAQNKSGQFDYLVQGVRKGYENHQVVQEEP
jgi:hypothetical protein